MSGEDQNNSRLTRSLTILTAVNLGIWAIALIALVFMLEKGSSPRGMYPILAGGVAVGIQQLAVARRLADS
jgi:hypothetical protein